VAWFVVGDKGEMRMVLGRTATRSASRIDMKRTLAAVAVIAAMVLVALPRTAWAATTWTVDGTTGLDTNDCIANPCKTISAVLAKPTFVAGDTINVAAGTVTDKVTITKAVTINGPASGTATVNANATAASGGSAFTVNIPAASPLQNVVISNLTITGGFYRYGGGIAHFNGNVTVNDSIVTNNTASTTTGGGGIVGVGAGVGGGGIFSSGTLTLNRVTVSNNKTVLGGTTPFPGAGLFTAGLTTVNDSTFTGNVANGNTLGGGVYSFRQFPAVPVATSFTATNTNFSANSAAFGGGIANSGSGAITLKRDAALSGNPSQLVNNTGTFGAAMYDAGTATVSDTTFGTNPAVSQAGALWLATFGTENPVFNGTNVTFTGNSAPVGGAIVTGVRSVLNLTGGSIDTNSGTLGGGMYVAGGTVGLSGTSVANNTATGGTTVNGGSGGGIYQATGSVALTAGTVVSGNKAVAATVTGSTATGWGGNIYSGPAADNNAPTISITDSTLSGGTAVVGAGIAVVGNIFAKAGTTPSKLTLTRATISGNNAGFGGGGIYNGGTVTATDSSILTNSAAFAGGGLYNGSTVVADTPTVTLTNTTVKDNTSANIAGGVANLIRAVLKTTSGSIEANKALSAGGLYVQDGGTATLDGTAIKNNIADGGSTNNAGDGGGVYSAGTLTIKNAVISGNEAKTTTTPGSGNASGEGGALFAASNQSSGAVKTTLTGVTVNGNKAVIGSALVTASTAGTNATSILNSTITGNTSTSAFGAILPVNPVSIVFSTITDNTAAAGGGGGIVAFAAGVARVAGTIISGNKAGAATVNCVSAPADGGYNLSDPGDNSCGFTAANHDLSANPQLGALANNGGPTPTQLPAASSPVINAIPAGFVTTIADAVSTTPVTLCDAGAVDQRGVSRPQGANCDIGSVEADLSAPTLAGPSNPTFVVGAAGTFAYTTTGVPTPHLSETGALPAGVTFVDNGNGTATLAGTPAAGTGGNYPITVTASNGVGSDASMAVTVTVKDPPTVTGPSTATFVVNSAGSVDFGSTGFPTPSLSESGALPSGVTFVDHGDGTATLAGTPAAGTQGTYNLTIRASNGTTDATKAFTLTVNPAVTVATTALPHGAVGVTYNAQLAASGGLPPYTWQITAGALPTGLSMSDSGAITGTPTGPAGSASITFLVIDSLNPAGTDSKTLTLTIDRGPTTIVVQPVLFKTTPLGLPLGVVSARLTGGVPGMPLAGQTIVFTAGSTAVCTGLTGADGVASCTASVASTTAIITNLGVTATYAGNTFWMPAQAKGGLIG
jgi:hypothetical protein